MGEIEKVGADDIAGAARSLAKAFHDDPVFTYLLGGTPLAEQSGVTFFTAFLKIQVPHGHVYRSAGGEAAAIWAPPGEWKVPNKEIVRFLPAMFTVFGKRLVPALRTLAGWRSTTRTSRTTTSSSSAPIRRTRARAPARR